MKKRNEWHKVFYRFFSTYAQEWFTTFEYALGEEQIKRVEDKYKEQGTYIKTEPWTI